MKTNRLFFSICLAGAVGCAGGDEFADADGFSDGFADADGFADDGGEEVELGSVALAQSSRDYPGPCTGESTVAGTPRFLATDVATKPFDSAIINLEQTGRMRLGISCVNTRFKVIRLGSGETVFEHRCTKHGFGWYDVTNLAPGAYRATSESRSFIIENVLEGHGTMDTYAYAGNNGAFQPVNCAPPGAPSPSAPPGGGGGGPSPDMPLLLE